MPILAIISGVHCRGDEVTSAISARTGWRRISSETIESAAQISGLSVKKVTKALYDPPGLLDGITHERQRGIAAVREVLAGLIRNDNLIIDTPAAYLLPRSISHILRVCIIADFDSRLKIAFEKENLSHREATKQIHQGDAEAAQLIESATGRKVWSEDLFDIVLPMHRLTVDEAVESIIQQLSSPVVQPTADSLRETEWFLISGKVAAALATTGHEIDVSCKDGNVLILINKYVSRFDAVEEEFIRLANSVEGVKNVEVRPGPKFIPPSLLRTSELDLPQKVLLVDDERDFVQTLSERLKTRKYVSTIAYDGEQAIEMIKTDEPEVMVLDLKMPGIDGIEVLRQTKRDHPNVEVIILTGHGSEREEAIAKELGAFAYLKKPVDIEDLSKEMKKAYEKIRKGREAVVEVGEKDFQ